MITVYETADTWRVVKGAHVSDMVGAAVRCYLTVYDALMVETRECIREALCDIQYDEITAQRRKGALK